jgi:hypothetical protein
VDVTRREHFFLVGPDERVLYRDAGESAVRIPDARARWEAIWERRATVVEIAHSHPIGPLAFSAEDETTMAAIESALGKRVVFSVVAPDGMLRRQEGRDVRVSCEPRWAGELREVSGMDPEPRPSEGREPEEPGGEGPGA